VVAAPTGDANRVTLECTTTRERHRDEEIMTVRPTSSGQIPGTAIGRSDRTAGPAPASRPTEPNTTSASGTTGTRRDDVQISAQARQLQQADAATRGPAGELSAERLRQVLGRMNDGHYDQPEVQDTVLRRVAREL
jgi:hypothetical protein